MAWSITDRFPLWGENGEFPNDGFFYEGNDQVNEKHLDALWNGIKEFEGETKNALEEIDSDGDGIVDEAEIATVSTTALSFEVRANDPESPEDGRVWIVE